ncbi:hypothetical protein [Vibrio methylphosphonaticus]|uniref:hypothetical protein n=1 Tax=Vibrio methylphosphonaticus TaxID=2946866 RepID=UPI00202A8E71|nr:hypothetical protein [Vibrio methylphosphonaticus]MCL9773966.1 hypothetical protein [Vibrio methylphosphonaticus]
MQKPMRLWVGDRRHNPVSILFKNILFKNMLFTTLLYFMAAFHVQASWIDDFIAGHIEIRALKDVEALVDVYDCGETEHKYYCGFDLDYRGVPMNAEIHLTKGQVTRIKFIADMMPYHYTRIPYNLRVDNYQLEEVTVGQEKFNIPDLLGNATPDEVDKKLVEFLNLHRISDSKLFTWIHKNEIQDRFITDRLCMKSGKEQISLEWISNPAF